MKKIIFSMLAVILCFTLTGCFDKKNEVKQEEKNQEQNQEQEQIVENNNDEENATQDVTEISVSLDDEKFTFTTNEAEIHYYYSGDELTGLDEVRKYEDEESAKAAYKDVMDNKESYEQEVGKIEKVEVEGTTVKIIYSKEVYAESNYSEVKAIYDIINLMNNGELNLGENEETSSEEE